MKRVCQVFAVLVVMLIVTTSVEAGGRRGRPAQEPSAPRMNNFAQNNFTPVPTYGWNWHPTEGWGFRWSNRTNNNWSPPTYQWGYTPGKGWGFDWR